MTQQLWAFIWTFIVSIIGPSVKKVMIAMGMGFVTYQGFDAGLDLIKGHVYAAIGTAPAQVVQMLGFLEVDKAINVIFSAIAFRAVLSGFKNGDKINSIWRTPGSGGGTFPA